MNHRLVSVWVSFSSTVSRHDTPPFPVAFIPPRLELLYHGWPHPVNNIVTRGSLAVSRIYQGPYSGAK